MRSTWLYPAKHQHIFKSLQSEIANRLPGHCQAAVARAIDSFGQIDILLCCSSEGKCAAAPCELPSLVLIHIFKRSSEP